MKQANLWLTLDRYGSYEFWDKKPHFLEEIGEWFCESSMIADFNKEDFEGLFGKQFSNPGPKAIKRISEIRLILEKKGA